MLSQSKVAYDYANKAVAIKGRQIKGRQTGWRNVTRRQCSGPPSYALFANQVWQLLLSVGTLTPPFVIHFICRPVKANKKVTFQLTIKLGYLPPSVEGSGTVMGTVVATVQ